MNFLAPLFLAGAAAVALPIIFHLIRRSSREKVLFSSLMFLEPSPPRLTKRSRLEHIFLLILRSLVVCLLALAFARPFLPKAMPAGATPGEKQRVAILIDASASMRREDLWNLARNRAAAIIRSLKADDAVSVYLFDHQLRTLFNFAESAQVPANERAAATEARLAGVNPGWAGTHLGNALLNATEYLLEEMNADSADQGNSRSRLVVISDFQTGAKLDGLQGFEWPKKLNVQLEPLIARETFNAHLQVLEDTQRTFLAVTNGTVRARLHNSPKARSEDFQVFWNDSSGLASDKVRVYVPPGQSRILVLPKRTNATASLMLSGDAVDLDNTVHVASQPSRNVTVAYWGSEPANDPNGMRYYIHRAFEQTNLATRVIGLSNTVPAEAREAAFLIIGEPTAPALSFARELLGRGRSVFLPVRGPADVNAISDLLGVLVTATEAPVKNYALFGQISFQDPLFAPFSDARFSDFTKIHFWKHRVLNLANVTNATTISTFDSGSPALASVPVATGRLLVLGTTWKPSDSQFALSSKFVPLLFGMLEQSVGISQSRHQFVVGETVSLPNSETNVVTLPGGTAVQIVGRNFSQTAEPGLYRSGDYQFAVNLDPAESRFAPMPPEDLVSLGVPVGREILAGDKTAAEKRERHLLATEAESRQKLWRWFVVVAIAILLLETWLAGRLSRLASSPA